MKKGRVIFDICESTRQGLIEEHNKMSMFFRGSRNEVLGNPTYSYLVIPEDLQIGELVVVETKNTMSLATFVGYDPIAPKGTELKYIISRVDIARFEGIKFEQRRKAELLELMNEKKKKLEETVMYEMLAEKDPELKAMLEEFKSLNRD